MSILIKGMEMPRGCDECYIREKDTCPLLKVNVDECGRLVGCPLIELPDHGDLIDAEEQMRLMRGYEYDTYDDYNRAFDMLDNAPTIIPAERSEDERKEE